MMYKVLTLNNISVAGLDRLPREKYEIASEIQHPDAILLRSFKMHDMSVPDSVLAVGRAGAGTNNIPVAKFSKLGVPVFNTPGANANAVKELVIAGLLMAARNLPQALDFVRTLKSSGDELDKAVETTGTSSKNLSDQVAIARRAAEAVKVDRFRLPPPFPRIRHPPPQARPIPTPAASQQEQSAKFQSQVQELENDRREKLRSIQLDAELEIQEIQRRFKLAAVISPPIPPLLVGLIVFTRRRLREREGISKARRIR